MDIVFVIPGPLRTLTAQRAEVRVSGDAASVGDALGLLWTECPALRDRILTERGDVRQHVNIFVDGENIRYQGAFRTPVRDGSEVIIVPAVSGGAPEDTHMDADGRVVVITGASSGIGAALAGLLASRGSSVALLARREDALREVAGRCGGRALPVVTDVTRRDEVRRAVEASIAHFGHVDVWVNNAGQGITRMPSALSDDDIDDMMRANVKSALYGMQEILPHFTARGSGHIINVSSMLGRAPLAVVRSAYSAAKHFLNALTANLRDELLEAHPGIQVSLVSPGVVATDFGLNARHGGIDSRQFPGSQTAGEVAAVIADVITSRRADVYTRAGSHARIAEYLASLGEDP